MTDINVDEIGPVDYLVVGFPAEEANFSGEMASELKALIDSNTIRVLDLLIVTRGEDGSVDASELRDADDSEIGEKCQPSSSPRQTHDASGRAPTRRRRMKRWPSPVLCDRTPQESSLSCSSPVAKVPTSSSGWALEETGFHGDWITWDLGSLGC
jgi:hypothetical protein